MITVFLDVKKDEIQVNRYLVNIESKEELNEEAIVDELQGLLVKWLRGWLHFQEIKISIESVGP